MKVSTSHRTCPNGKLVRSGILTACSSGLIALIVIYQTGEDTYRNVEIFTKRHLLTCLHLQGRVLGVVHAVSVQWPGTPIVSKVLPSGVCSFMFFQAFAFESDLSNW